MLEKPQLQKNPAFVVYPLFKKALEELELQVLYPHLKICAIKNREITIASDEGIWLQELSLHTEKIIFSINANTDIFKIDKIKLVIKEI